MERADGNRSLWLLKSTSNRYGPERLAVAIALGILAGLVPKLNLLAVALYALIVLLPVPTLPALLISAVVAVISWNLDIVTHPIGSALLKHEALRPMWISLEQMPLVPWMSLHNTVVLGNFVLGLLLLAPTYLISSRVLDRMFFAAAEKSAVTAGDESHSVRGYAPVTADEDELLFTKRSQPARETHAPHRHQRDVPAPSEAPAERSPLIIPPPKLQRMPQEFRSDSHRAELDEPVVFEPVSQSSSLDSTKYEAHSQVKAWHVNRDASGRPMAEVMAMDTLPPAKAAQTGSRSTVKASAMDLPARKASPQDESAGQSGIGQQGIGQLGIGQLGLAPTGSDQLPPFGALGSLELAQSASEVLAWVDDLLDECLAEEGMAIVAPRPEPTGISESIVDNKHSTDMLGNQESGQQPRWLLETTIEIVRLSDESLVDSLLTSDKSSEPDAQPQPSGQSSGTSEEARARDSGNEKRSGVMSAESMTRAWPTVGKVAGATSTRESHSPVISSLMSSTSTESDSGEPTILSLNQTSRGSIEKRVSPAFQQLVMAGVDKPGPTQTAAPVEPVRGECLANLLGHLRQSREGKST